jgi:hypothetical protein
MMAANGLSVHTGVQGYGMKRHVNVRSMKRFILVCHF